MLRRRHALALAAFIACCCGCNENPFSTAPESQDAESQDTETQVPETQVPEPQDAEPQELTAQQASENPPVTINPPVVAVATRSDGAHSTSDRFQQRIGELFEQVLPTLDQARQLVDRHASLPDDSRVPFKQDKQSNSANINELLDDAIVILGVSEVSDYRQRISEATTAISTAHENIADYRRQRVSASWAKDQSQLDKVNPFELSKEALDQRIASEQAEIEKQTKLLVHLKKSFADELSKIGLTVDQEGVDSLLSSVSGDDIVTMAVVFDNVKHITAQLQELTEESGEALDVAKRYYGMYVVMIHVMDRIQKTFIRDINEKHIPKLHEFASQADVNISQAKALIKIDGGERELLEANIASNRLTRETATLYVEYLRRNADLIAAENKRAQKNLATAMNTYDTVKLSSDVAALMNTGRRDFETLMKLQVPPLREFNNEEIRKEFQRMTSEPRRQLNGGQSWQDGIDRPRGSLPSPPGMPPSHKWDRDGAPVDSATHDRTSRRPK